MIDFLRKKGVLSYSGNGVSLSLLPEEPPVIVEEPKKDALKPAPRIGKDGLTSAQQAEMYGVAFSDTRE